MSLKFKNNGEWVKIPATDDFTKLKNMPFTLISKDDTRFSSIDTMFSYDPDSSGAKCNVDPGTYVLEDDITFTANYGWDIWTYYIKMFSGEEPTEDDLRKLEVTLPKSTVIGVDDDNVNITCPNTVEYKWRDRTGSSGGATISFEFIVINYDEDHGVASLVNAANSMSSKIRYFDAIWYALISNSINHASFKEGQAIVTSNSASGSGSFPTFKLADVGVQSTNITDDDYKNYQTMGQWLALDDGMYLVNTDKLSIQVTGKDRLYSEQMKVWNAALGWSETYDEKVTVPKGNYISIYTTAPGGSFYYKYKMMTIYQTKADPSTEETSQNSSGASIVIKLASTEGSSTTPSWTLDAEVYDLNRASLIQSIVNSYTGSVFTPLMGDKEATGYDAPTEGQIAQWHGDIQNGFKLAGVDKDSISPIKVITESDKDNYNTLDKLCHLDDGVYLYNGTTAIELTYKSVDVFMQLTGNTGEKVGDVIVFDKDILLNTGSLFSVSSPDPTNHSEYKYITFICGAHKGDSYGYTFIDVSPDSGTGTEADPYKYGTTGENCTTFSTNQLAYYGGLTSMSLFKNLLFSGKVPTDGQVAQFVTDTTSPLGVTIQGADVGSSVPITVINADNKDNFTTLDKICHQPDGLYIVDDCGESVEDYEFEIEGIKGYSMTMLNMTGTKEAEIGESQSIWFKKGSTIQIYSWETSSIKNCKRVNIYNTEGGQGYSAGHGEQIGNLIFHIEAYPESGTGTEADPYVYGVTGETTYYLDSNENDIFNAYAQQLCLKGLLSGSGEDEPDTLIGLVEDKTVPLGLTMTMVDKSNFQSPFTIINNDNADNYNTLDKLCHLDDGIYICKDEYSTAKKDYIVEVSFKGIEYASAAAAGFSGDSPTPDSNGTTKCKNGAIISVVTQTGSTKNKVVRITHGLDGNVSTSKGNGFDDIYIIAAPDDSSASTLVYGVTGANTAYYRPVSTLTIFGNLFPYYAMSDTLYSGDEADGKMAVWKKDNANAEMPMLSYADIPSGGSSPINVVNDDNWSNFDTLQKWFNADPGVYYIDLTKQSSGFVKPFTASYTYTNPLTGNKKSITDGDVYLAQKTVVYHTLSNDSASGAANFHHLFIMEIDLANGLGTGNDPRMLCDFVWDKRETYNAQNVELMDYGTGAAGVSELFYTIMYLAGVVFGSITSSDIGKMVKIGSPSSTEYGNEFEFQAVDISLVGSSTDITPTQVRDAINEGKPVTISYTDTTYGTLKFTGFGTVSTASGDTVSASITYGSATDSFMLFTLMGDVTGGTWTMYSRSVPTLESIG